MQKSKFSKYALTILLGLVLSLNLNACGRRHHVEHETTTTTTEVPHSHETEEVTTTTTSSSSESTEHADSCGGVLSCTVDFVGAVIAFPFKLIGSVVGAVF